MAELTQRQLTILEKLPENVREETIDIISRSREKFNERLEIYSKVKKWYEDGLGWKKIVELTDISRNIIDGWIYREIKPRYKLILPDAVDVIKKLKESDLTNVEIGNLLNVTSTTVGRLLNPKEVEYNKKNVYLKIL